MMPVRLLVAICLIFFLKLGYAGHTRTLVVGSEQDYPPFATGQTAATAGGFTVDLWKVIARNEGLKYTLRVEPFHQLLQDFKDGKIDLLINLAQSEERRQFADFTVPHVTVHGAIFIRKGTHDIRSENDLEKKSIIVVKADIAHEYAASKGWGSHLIHVPTAADGLRLLASGQHDAMFVSKLVGVQTVEQLKLSNIVALPITAGATQKFSFAVRKGDADLLALLNEGLALSKSSGAYDTLHQKWFSIYEDKEPTLRDVLKYLAPLLAIFVGYVMVSYYRQRNAMRQLAESHHMLQTIIETIPMRVFWKDRESRFLGCNTLFANDAGKTTPTEVIGRTDTEMPWSREAPCYRADDQMVIESGTPKLAYEEPQTTDGKSRWVRTSKAPILNLNRQPIGVLGVYDDITNIKATEQALHDNQIQLKSLFDNMTNGFALHEVIRNEAGVVIDYRFLTVNAAFEKSTGLLAENIIGKTIKEIFPDVESYWIENYAHVTDTGESRYLENYSAGIGRWFSSYAYRPAPNQFAVMVEDVTERKRATDALAESEKRLSDILENVSAYIYLKDHQRPLPLCQQTRARTLGRSDEGNHWLWG